MELVVDTNILFSFFRDNPVRSLILSSKFLNLRLFTPEYALEELNANELDLMKYSKLSAEQLESVTQLMKMFIEVKPESFFREFKAEARLVSPDPKDIPFFALALKLNSAIWSNEPRLKKQSSIKVFNTKEVREFLKLSGQ